VKVPAEVPEDSLVLRVSCLCCRSPISSTPASSPSEWQGLDNMKSQPWPNATRPRTTSCNVLLLILIFFVLTRQDKVLQEVVRGQVALTIVWYVLRELRMFHGPLQQLWNHRRYEKTLKSILYYFKKHGQKISHHFSNPESRLIRFEEGWAWTLRQDRPTLWIM